MKVDQLEKRLSLLEEQVAKLEAKQVEGVRQHRVCARRVRGNRRSRPPTDRRVPSTPQRRIALGSERRTTVDRRHEDRSDW